MTHPGFRHWMDRRRQRADYTEWPSWMRCHSTESYDCCTKTTSDSLKINWFNILFYNWQYQIFAMCLFYFYSKSVLLKVYRDEKDGVTKPNSTLTYPVPHPSLFSPSPKFKKNFTPPPDTQAPLLLTPTTSYPIPYPFPHP